MCLRFVAANTIEHKILLCVLLALIGLLLSFVLTPLMADIAHVVIEMDTKNLACRSVGNASAEAEGRNVISSRTGAFAQVYGLYNIAVAAGCLIGPFWGGIILDSAGWQTLCWTMGLLCGISAVPVFCFVGETRKPRSAER